MAHAKQLVVGDIVERIGGKSKYTRGRVTGFAPNGAVRVRVGYQVRIWPKEQVWRDLEELRAIDRDRAEAVKLIDDWVDRCGGWDEARKVCRLVWPDEPAYW